MGDDARMSHEPLDPTNPFAAACAADPALALGVNTLGGRLTNTAVAQAHGLQSVTLDQVWG